MVPCQSTQPNMPHMMKVGIQSGTFDYLYFDLSLLFESVIT